MKRLGAVYNCKEMLMYCKICARTVIPAPPCSSDLPDLISPQHGDQSLIYNIRRMKSICSGFYGNIKIMKRL